MTERNIGTRRQLFVDDFWIDHSEGVTRRLHEPVRRDVAIAAEHPWERDGVSYMVAFREGDRFRGWYRCDAKMYVRKKRQVLIAYAESSDGIHWEKPVLGLIEFAGCRENNLVWTGPGNNMSPFRDDAPDVPGEERYKAIVRDRPGVFALVSPDGLRWRLMQEEPILTEGPFDSHNIAFRDAWKDEYVIYCRGVAGEGNFSGGVRWIRRTTSQDFRTWTRLEPIDVGDTPFEHLYTNATVPYYRAPHIYLSFPKRFVTYRIPQHLDPAPAAEWPGLSDGVLMSSRDGVHWHRFMEAFIRPGRERRNWIHRNGLVARGIVPTAPGELSLYLVQHYTYPSAHLQRVVVRTDGFASASAGYPGGELITKPFRFSGENLVLNYSTSAAGSIRVEVQDVNGNPVPELSLTESVPIWGDELAGKAGWIYGGKVREKPLRRVAGKTVRLRFVLQDADLYSFRFR